MRRAVFALAVLLAIPLGLRAQKSAPEELGELLTKVGAAVEEYYLRAQSIICLEEVVLRMLGYDTSSLTDVPPRRLAYDLRVAWDASVDGGAPEPTVQRNLLKVNNRPPREKDKPQCLDPAAVSPDTLQMLLRHNQKDYTFTHKGSARVSGRAAIMVDYVPRDRGDVTVKTYHDREDCFSVDFPGYERGRVWVDRETYDVLRLDVQLSRPVDVMLPATTRRDAPLGVVFERVDSSMLFRPVKFRDPDETVLLPYSVEETTVVRNAGVPRTRTSRRFSQYRRFTTDVRIVEE